MSDDYTQQNSHIRNDSTPISTATFIAIVFALVFALVSFFTGVSFGAANTTQSASIFSFFQSEPKPAQTVDLDEFWRVWDLMEEKFATASSTDTPSVEDRLFGAINGLVGSYGDSYSVYLPPREAESFNENISGNFGGVGMEVGMRNNVVTIIAPLPNTPAEKAGILAGDIIVEIDGVSTERMSIDKAVELIRGERGTEVVLKIAREGEFDFLDVAITRDTITIPTVDTELRDGVFVISLYSFNAQAEAMMQEALREYVRSGADKLVLDMRGNPGGFLQSAIAISSFFLPTGTPIVTEEFGDDRRSKVFRSQGRVVQNFQASDMVVLVDGGSASASEIVAGALSEHGVATLMGTQTFGKGSVQELVSLPSGASLKVTVARWVTPNGVSISDGGLEPEIVVERTRQQRIDDIDPQLEAAIDFLFDRFEAENYAVEADDTEE